ncbi:UDP-N-acetylglucosamine 2-epimerase [Rhodobacteraceae bacterium nBUS_24]
MSSEITIVSSSRADWSILRCLLAPLSEKNIINLLLIGVSHSKYVESDLPKIGLQIKPKITKLHHNETPRNTLEVMNALHKCMKSFCDLDEKSLGKCIIVLGDRIEILPVVILSKILGKKIIHFCGGDKTAGSIDDNTRRAITSFSDLHFATNKQSYLNIISAGANRDSVKNFGHIILDSKQAVSNTLELKPSEIGILVTIHPDTTKSQKYNENLAINSLTAIERFSKKNNARIFLSDTNSDNYSEEIRRNLVNFSKKNKNWYSSSSFGPRNFLELLTKCHVFVGNSSSIFYEAPQFDIVSVNIGDRQKGRVLNSSIIQSNTDITNITKSLQMAIKRYPCPVRNPYFKELALNLTLNEINNYVSGL